MPRLTRDDFLAALAGAGQGATFDFGDEIYGAGRGAYDAITGRESIADAYGRYRDQARGEIKRLEEASPNAYMAGDIASAFVPGVGQAGVAAKASKPLLKRALQMAVMGGAGGLGRSEADNAGDMARDTLESAAMSAGTGVGMDQFMRRVGDVIDFKKMRDKLKAEKIGSATPEAPLGGKPTGNLGKPSKEMMAENNRRAMEEAGLQRPSYKPGGAMDDFIQTVKDSRATRQTEGNVTSIGDRPLPREAIPEPKEYTPEDALERVKSRFEDWDTDATTSSTKRLIEKLEKEGADEPYVGRDYHAVIALENPKNRDVSQPLPVPPSKIGDLKGVLGKGVLTGDSDPFAWVDSKYGVSKALLEREKNKPLKIFTRSDLIGHDDYLERIGKNHEVNMVFSTPNKSIGRLIEPGAPSLARRITAANKLAENGVKVNFHYQMFDNKKLPASWAKFQPSELEVLKELREMGLNPSIKLQVERTPIQDKNLKEMLKVLGLEMDPKTAAKERALDKARGRTTKKDEE